MMVTVTVPEDRKAEFLKVLDNDVRGSRYEEDGCLRMDLLQDETDESNAASTQTRSVSNVHGVRKARTRCDSWFTSRFF